MSARDLAVLVVLAACAIGAAVFAYLSLAGRTPHEDPPDPD